MVDDNYKSKIMLDKEKYFVYCTCGFAYLPYISMFTVNPLLLNLKGSYDTAIIISNKALSMGVFFL